MAKLFDFRLALAAEASRRATLSLGPISVPTKNAPLLRGEDGGANRDRTDDLKLAKLALSQLSYGPVAR